MHTRHKRDWSRYLFLSIYWKYPKSGRPEKSPDISFLVKTIKIHTLFYALHCRSLLSKVPQHRSGWDVCKNLWEATWRHPLTRVQSWWPTSEALNWNHPSCRKNFRRPLRLPTDILRSFLFLQGEVNRRGLPVLSLYSVIVLLHLNKCIFNCDMDLYYLLMVSVCYETCWSNKEPVNLLYLSCDHNKGAHVTGFFACNLQHILYVP